MSCAGIVGVSMSSFPWSLEAVTDATANLIAQLRELERLRERVRKAELARGSRRGRPQRKNAHSAVEPRKPLTPLIQSENRRSVSPT